MSVALFLGKVVWRFWPQPLTLKRYFENQPGVPGQSELLPLFEGFRRGVSAASLVDAIFQAVCDPVAALTLAKVPQVWPLSNLFPFNMVLVLIGKDNSLFLPSKNST